MRTEEQQKIFYRHSKSTIMLSKKHWFQGLKVVLVVFALYGSIKTKKSPSPHIFNFKIRLKYHTVMPFLSTDRYDPKDACKYSLCVLKSNKNFFITTQTRSDAFKILIFWVIFVNIWLLKSFRVLETTKSPSCDIFAIKNCLKHRLMFSFASACCHRLVQVCNNLFWCL